ncbi:hypothetical protein DXG01_005438 [Tephrocybe rancida]|nr:hypothetical protein DXG01_005438 [Tephrocybe rancida]
MPMSQHLDLYLDTDVNAQVLIDLLGWTAVEAALKLLIPLTKHVSIVPSLPSCRGSASKANLVTTNARTATPTSEPTVFVVSMLLLLLSSLAPRASTLPVVASLDFVSEAALALKAALKLPTNPTGQIIALDVRSYEERSLSWDSIFEPKPFLYDTTPCGSWRHTRPHGPGKPKESERLYYSSCEVKRAMAGSAAPRPIMLRPDASTSKPEPTLPELHQASQIDTKYVNMLLALDSIPRLHNMMASFFTWILLAGFVLFPGTFTSLQNTQSSITNEAGREVLNAVAHVPLPGLLNSLAGFISTIANIFGVQHGEFSKTGKVTIVVTGASTLICGVLTLYYSLWKIRRVKQRHDREVGMERAGRHGEGIVEKMKRKAAEKEPEVPMF